MQLNKMQQVASDSFQYWYKHPESRYRPWFEISGAAGTGKTTVVRHIIDNLGLLDYEVIFIAYVGKAALALRLSGVNGRTIHSVIYRPSTKPKKDENGRRVYENSGKLRIQDDFIKVSHLPDYIKLIVVDEGGMVNREIGSDILSFGIPTLVLGDLNQLPPVFGESLFLHKPDVILNEIMRQSKDSPIIYYSQLAIHGFDLPLGPMGNCMVKRHSELTDDDLRESDLLICQSNAERDFLNNYVRSKVLGIESNVLVPGDKLICRQNCWSILLDDDNFDIDISLVNGMIGNVTNIYKDVPPGYSKKANMMIDFKPEFSNKSFENIIINAEHPFEDYTKRTSSNPKFSDCVSFEFGYCSTCHLAQGSQYPTVTVFADSCSKSIYGRKWLYTAITRAKSRVNIIF